MFYNHFSEHFDSIYLFVFIKKFEFEFVIIVVYDDNLNIIETYEELPKVEYLEKEFEIKGLGKQNFVLAYRSSI